MVKAQKITLDEFENICPPASRSVVEGGGILGPRPDWLWSTSPEHPSVI